MEIRILHLSDLHFEANNQEQDSKFEHLINKLVEENNKRNFDYIFITGDIINIGKTEYYSIALKYFNKLIRQLNFNKQNIFIVPGNHDIDFKIEKEVEKGIRVDLQKATFDKIRDIERDNIGIIEQTRMRQDAYFKFVQELGINGTTFPFIINRNGNFSIIGINSAIFSSKTEHRNQIYFINNQFEQIRNNNNFRNNQIFILTHHPIDYYEETTKDEILLFARQLGAFIFSGHSHTQAYERQYRNDQAAFQFWCGNFQNNTASFNIIDIDYDIGAFKLSVGNYNDEWVIDTILADRINEFESRILSFLMDIKSLNKVEQFRRLWDELFFNPNNPQNLKFEDYWNVSDGIHPTIEQKKSEKELRNCIRHSLSMGEACLFYLLFEKIDRFYVFNSLFKNIPVDLARLDFEPETRYKRDLLNTAAYKLPEMFRFP